MRDKFDTPMSGSSLEKMLKENNIKLEDITITHQHIQYFEDWEEDFIVISWEPHVPTSVES